jgi:hypothetical protein
MLLYIPQFKTLMKNIANGIGSQVKHLITPKSS